MNGVSTETRSSARAAARWMGWIVGGLGIALCLVIFLLWGLIGPTYIFDLIAAYCG
jgi:flagellar biogenesis protein FliO